MEEGNPLAVTRQDDDMIKKHAFLSNLNSRLIAIQLKNIVVLSIFTLIRSRLFKTWLV